MVILGDDDLFTAKGNVDLTRTTHKDFVLAPMTNPEDWIRQLPGDEFLNALPGDTPEDYRMKTLVRKNCTAAVTTPSRVTGKAFCTIRV